MSRKFVYFIGAVIFLFSPPDADCQSAASNPGTSQTNAPAQSQVQAKSNGMVGSMTPGPSAQPHTKHTHTHSEEYYQSRQAISEERMARYSKYSFWASLLQAVASVFGIFFIAWTLWETHKTTKALEQANIDARTLNDSERRPWLSIKAANKDYFVQGVTLEVGGEPHPDQLGVLFTVNVSNVGQSPATDVQIRAEIEITDEHLIADRLRDRFESHEIIAEKFNYTVFPNDTVPIKRLIFIRKNDLQNVAPSRFRPCLIVYCAVQYSSNHFEGRRQTCFACLMELESFAKGIQRDYWITQNEEWKGRPLNAGWNSQIAD